MNGKWLSTTAFLESGDPGCRQYFKQVATGCLVGEDSDMCFLDPYVTSSAVQAKRAIARHGGSTYAYDFLGITEVGLIGEWENYLRKQGIDATTSTPSQLVQYQDLREGPDGELVLRSRPIGSGKIGMVAWLVMMKTP